MSEDCNVTSDDADNHNIKCTRKKHVKETCRFIRRVMTTSEQNGNVMLCILAHWLNYLSVIDSALTSS